MDEEQGITALGPEDLGTVEVTPNVEETEKKESAFPQFTDEAKASRGLEDLKKFKKGMKQALPYVGQLGLDLVSGSGIAEFFGQQADIVEGEKRPSYFEAFDRTVDYAKEGKTKEAIVSGVDTALTAIGGVGEGAMAASVLTGKFAPLIAGLGWGVAKLSDKGKLVLKSTKTGKEVLANFKRADTPEGDVKLDIKNVEIPKDDTSDEIKTLEDNIDIPTFRTDVKEQIKGYKAKKIFSDSDGTGYNYRGFQIRSFDDPFNPGKKNFNISEYDADGNVKDAFDASDTFKGAKDRVDELLFYENPNPAEMALMKTDKVSTVKQDVVEVETPKQETPEVETSKQDADFIETKPVDTDAPKQDEGIKALGPKTIEDIIKPKGEIRNQGGFKFNPEVTQKNLRLQKTRLKKLKEGVQTAGEPKNKRIVLKSDNPDNPDFAIGKINFDDWTKRVEKVLSDDEIKGATNWYSEVYDYFKSAPYIKSEEEAKTLAQAWFAGAQRKSPQKALANVLSIRSLLRQGKTPEEILAMDKIEEGGLEGATKAILSVLTGREASGVGFKIADFRDNLDNKNVRSVMGNDPEGGQPFTVDVHTARDMGLVDPSLLSLLKDKGYKIPDNIIDDFGEGGLSNDLYQNRAIFGLELTDHLNKIKWKGKDDWQPSEIQAIGWTTLTNLYGGVNTAGNIKDALNLNVRRVSMEVKPGTGSPWDKMFGKDYSELPISDQIKINDEITNEAVNEIAKSENVDLYNNVFGTGGWQTYVNPSTVQEILGIKSEAIRIGAKLGYVLNQTEIFINGSKAMTKNPQAYSYDIIENNTSNLRNSKYVNDLFTKIYEKTNGVIVGFQPIETIDNKVGIRIIVGQDTVNQFYKDRKIPKKGNENKKNQFFEKDLIKQVEDVIPKDVNFELNVSESDLTVLTNDWKSKGGKDGQVYKGYFRKDTSSTDTTKSDRVLDNIRQKLTDSFRDKIRNAQGTKRPDTEEVLVPEDIETENIPKKSIGGFIERNTYDWVYLDG